LELKRSRSLIFAITIERKLGR